MSTSAPSKFSPHPCNPAQTQHNWAAIHSLLSRLPLEPTSAQDLQYMRWDNTNKRFKLDTVASAGCQDSANFVWDNTNNRLGIGTSSPVSKLAIGGTHTDTNHFLSVTGTLNNPNTSQQDGFQNQANFNPGGASLDNLFGLINIPTVTGSSITITTATGAVSRVDSAAGFSGAITNSNAFQAQNGTLLGGSIGTQAGLRVDSLNHGTTSIYAIRSSQPGIKNGTVSTTDSITFAIPAASVAMGDQTATTTNAHGVSVGIVTYTSTTNVRTLTNCASVYVSGAPVASTNITVTNGPYALWIDGGTSRLDGPIDMRDYIEGTEIADPAAPAANKGRLYFRDNGAGKTQLVVRFPTGAIQVIATEP